eukprot:9209622-Alexandrium_andersonii.AAC.1
MSAPAASALLGFPFQGGVAAQSGSNALYAKSNGYKIAPIRGTGIVVPIAISKALLLSTSNEAGSIPA